MRPTDQLEQWEWIEAYYQNRLPSDERLEFEKELDADEEFRETALQLQAAEQALRSLSLDYTVRKSIRKELAQGRLFRRLRLGMSRAVAGSLVLIGLGITYLTFDRVDLQPYRNDVALTQRYRDLDDDEQETALTPRQRTFYRDFFDAQAFLANGQPGIAITNLEKLARVDSLRPYFRQAVQWHLLNAYLLNNQPDNADATYRLLDQSGLPVYPVHQTDRWKVWWQIRWQKLTR
ncbi:anti-sigma factor [Spirosoma gilvum]